MEQIIYTECEPVILIVNIYFKDMRAYNQLFERMSMSILLWLISICITSLIAFNLNAGVIPELILILLLECLL